MSRPVSDSTAGTVTLRRQQGETYGESQRGHDQREDPRQGSQGGNERDDQPESQAKDQRRQQIGEKWRRGARSRLQPPNATHEREDAPADQRKQAAKSEEYQRRGRAPSRHAAR